MKFDGGMNLTNGIMLRIQQSDERSASRAAHINRGTTLATPEKRGEWMEAALLRADCELTASDLRSSYGFCTAGRE
jgi:hypothetical protein